MRRAGLLLLLSLGWSACPQPASDGDDGAGDDTDKVVDTDTDDTRPPPSCNDWCGLMSDHCPEDAVFPLDACQEFCDHPRIKVFPVGDRGEADTNTLACRVHHAELAAELDGEERLAACAAAHPSGGDVCGDWCEVYCHQMDQVCTNNNPEYIGPDIYPDAAACMDACQGFPTDVLGGISQTEQQFGYGDTVQCRLHHLQADVGHDQGEDTRFDLHCPHADVESTPDTCSDEAPPNLPNYCGYALTFCVGDNALFPEGTDIAGCAAMLSPLVGDGPEPYQALGFTSFTDSEGATLGCLNYWVTLAPVDPNQHCPNADWDPEGPGLCKG